MTIFKFPALLGAIIIVAASFIAGFNGLPWLAAILIGIAAIGGSLIGFGAGLKVGEGIANLDIEQGRAQ